MFLETVRKRTKLYYTRTYTNQYMRAYGVEIANFKLMVCSTIFQCIFFPFISFYSWFVLLFHLVNVASLNFQKKNKRKFKRNLKHIIWVPDFKIMIYARCSLLKNSNEKFFLSLACSPNKAKKHLSFKNETFANDDCCYQFKIISDILLEDTKDFFIMNIINMLKKYNLMYWEILTICILLYKCEEKQCAFDYCKQTWIFISLIQFCWMFIAIRLWNLHSI